MTRAFILSAGPELVTGGFSLQMVSAHASFRGAVEAAGPVLRDAVDFLRDNGSPAELSAAEAEMELSDQEIAFLVGSGNQPASDTFWVIGPVANVLCQIRVVDVQP